MRQSTLFGRTLREAPAEAQTPGHRLMLRAAIARPLASGLYTWLPLGFRVAKKVEQIIREEMDRIGSQEIEMPVVHPADLWRASGRYQVIGPELTRFKDRNGRDMVLAMTHEEVVGILLADIVRSYRQLPMMVYHFQTKWRDEPRARGGLIRVREFVMKDAYSCDRDTAGLDASYQQQYGAYEQTFKRLGLETVAVSSDVGIMGGTEAHEFMAPSPAGEDTVALCSTCDYASNVEMARGTPRAPEFPPPLDAPEEIETPGVTTIDGLAEMLGIDTAATAKAMVVVRDGDVVLALVRGDHRLHELKLSKVLQGPIRPATREEITSTFGAEPGSIGAVGAPVRVIADETLRDGQFVGGANRTGWHLRGVEAGRDFQAEFADIREVEPGDRCPDCADGVLRLEPAIEVGNIFKLGTRYSVPMNATYLDESGKEHPIVMGSYGIGPARAVAAAIEQGADDKGIVWPRSIAPWDVHLVGLGRAGDETMQAADSLYGALREAGAEVVYDDRDAGPGEKLTDAELLGCPLRLVVGKRALADGAVEAQARRRGEAERLPVADASRRALELLDGID